MNSTVQKLLAVETAKPVDPAITAMAEAVRQKHQGVLAILAYGSTLRDVSANESLIDLYVLTEDRHGVTNNAISRLGCALVPPNVYYGECRHNGKTYRAKYAVLPRAQFQARVKYNVSNPYFWARFAQPCRIIWAQDDIARASILKSLEAAVTTAFANAKAVASDNPSQDQWTALFQNTYRTELRPEAENRAAQIVQANVDYYQKLAIALQDTAPIRANWTLRRVAGKAYSVLRLIKASFTFQGGADYIAWKIKRHSGVEIAVTDWHRRHPLLAGIVLLPKLLSKGAIK
jgi:hypothetical protein